MLRHDELRASQREFSVKEMPALHAFPGHRGISVLFNSQLFLCSRGRSWSSWRKVTTTLLIFFLKLIAILPLFLSITLCFSRFFCFRGWKTWTGFDSLAQNVTFLWIWIEASYLTVFLILEIWQYQFVSLAWILKTADALVLSVYLSPSVHSELSKGVSHAEGGLRKKWSIFLNSMAIYV